MAKVTILDGARSIGGSKIHLQAGERGLLLDFGINFKRWALYYEEFLGPRTARGINDLLVLGILPPLKNLYRRDIFPSDFNFSPLDKELPLEAVFISHAHLDHCGHIGLLRGDIPIYTSSLTALFMKAIQDTGKSGLFSEMVYITKRQSSEDQRLLESTKNREGKTFFLFGDIKETMKEFWRRSPYSEGTPFAMKPLCPAENKIGGMEIRHYPVDHSILGASAYAFQTEEGWIVYTGDLRLGGSLGKSTEKFVEEVANLHPLALLIEGTNLQEEEAGKIREIDVYENCLKEVKEADGKMVVADFASRNLERLQSFLQIAKDTNRKLLILTKDMYLLEALDSVEGTNLHNDENIYMFEEMEEARRAWEKGLIENYKEKFIEPAEVKRNPGDYILCLSFLDIKHLTDTASERGGIYIYSSSEAFTEEQEIDFRRLNNWLKFLNLKPIGFYLDENYRPHFTPGYHCSGHASREELFEMVRCIRPKFLLPLHTEAPQAYQDLSDITHILLDDKRTRELEVNFLEKP